MPTLTSQNKITSKPYNDPAREQSFKGAYGLDAHITATNVNDQDGNWIEVTLRFQTKKNKVYVLTEYFKDGDDNSTDFVLLSYTKFNKKFERKFDRFVDAEVVLADLIQEEESGNS
jgi:hypothetical protein